MKTKEAHQQLIEKLQQQKSPALREAIIAYAHEYALSDLEWSELIKVHKEDVNSTVLIYELWLSQSCAPVIWERYLNFMKDNNVSQQTITAKMQQAFGETLYLVQGNDVIWHVYLDWLEKIKEDKNVVKDIFLQKLSAPHLSLQNTFSMYSQFISNNFDNYDQEMSRASKIVGETSQYVDSIMENEVQTTKDYSPEFWLAYLNSESKRNKKNRSFPLMNGIFQRGLYNAQTGDWIPFWLRFLEILFEVNASASTVTAFTKHFVKGFPDSCTAWCEYICQLNLDEGATFMEARSKVLELMESAPYAEWKLLALQALRFEFSCMMHSGSESVGECFFHDIEGFWDMALTQQDALHSLERYIVGLHEAMNEIGRCRQLLLLLTKTYSDQAEMWLFSFEFECRHGNYDSAEKILRAAANRSLILDWPERILDEWQRYTLLNGDTETIRQARLKSIQYLRQVNMQREEEERAQRKRKNQSDSNEPKKKLREEKMPHRDRENLCVSVQNVEGATEDDIKGIFGPCGDILSVRNALGLFLIEFSSQQGVDKALLKTGTALGDGFIRVERSVNTTLWVTNFPPHFSQPEVQKLFAVHGSVISVRFPSLTKNSRRRFCYAEFADANDAKNALDALNGKELKEGERTYKLVVKLSNPDQKEARNTVDGDEIIVKNLDFHKVDEQVLLSVASEYGHVEKVILPRKNGIGKNDGYGFIVFREKASAHAAAAGLNGKELYGRLLEVSLAKSKIPPAKSYKDSAARTVSIKNVPSSVSDEELKARFTEVGPMKSLTRNAEGALVEFEKVADAGFAIMRLNGVEIDGQSIIVGEKKDIAKRDNAKGPSEMMAPPSVRRRKLNPKAKKSNSDFRAMLG